MRNSSGVSDVPNILDLKMMHKIKKAAVTGKGSENAEFMDYKSRLENLSTYLRTSSAALNASEQAWKEVCNRQKVFAEQFANRYPDKDAMREFGKQSSAASQALVKEFVLKTDGSSAAHWQVDAVVQEYLVEIAEIADKYKPIQDALREVTMYNKKVDDLQNAKKADEGKMARNMEKLEEAKKAYEEILDSVVDTMKVTYNKRQVALKATYVAYWSSQLRAFNLLDAALEPTRAFVESAVEPISAINIKMMTTEDVETFIADSGSAPTTPTREPAGGEKVMPTSPLDDKIPEPAEPTAV